MSSADGPSNIPKITEESWIRSKIEGRIAFAKLFEDLSPEEFAKDWDANRPLVNEPFSVDESTRTTAKTSEAALEIAKKASAILKEHGATRVLLFGSLAEGRFSPGSSDIDIYFEGLSDTEALAATGQLLDIFGEDIIDPIPAPFCSPRLKAEIEATGTPM